MTTNYLFDLNIFRLFKLNFNPLVCRELLLYSSLPPTHGTRRPNSLKRLQGEYSWCINRIQIRESRKVDRSICWSAPSDGSLPRLLPPALIRTIIQPLIHMPVDESQSTTHHSHRRKWVGGAVVEGGGTASSSHITRAHVHVFKMQRIVGFLLAHGERMRTGKRICFPPLSLFMAMKLSVFECGGQIHKTGFSKSTEANKHNTKKTGASHVNRTGRHTSTSSHSQIQVHMHVRIQLQSVNSDIQARK